MAMKIHVTVFWVVTPHSNVVKYQCLGRACCLHLQAASWYPTTSL